MGLWGENTGRERGGEEMTFMKIIIFEAQFITKKKKEADLKNNTCYQCAFLFVMPMTQT